MTLLSNTTPGPWHIAKSPDSARSIWIHGPNGEAVATCRDKDDSTEGHVRRLANATLIKSAPQLAEENAKLRAALVAVITVYDLALIDEDDPLGLDAEHPLRAEIDSARALVRDT